VPRNDISTIILFYFILFIQLLQAQTSWMDVVGVEWIEWKVLLIVGSSSKIRQNL